MLNKFRTLVFAAALTLPLLVAAQPIIPSSPQLAAKSWILIDAQTGEVLAEKAADEVLEPASLTKMMTIYIVSEEIEAGRMSEDEEVSISVNAWQKGGTTSGGSTMFLSPDTQVEVIDLMRGVIVQSGNDASIALAEHIAGSEESFAEVMNAQAQRLGMTQTHFENSTGWPAEGHVTTARDMAILAAAVVRDHPDHYELYAEREFEYAGINQPNRNELLWRDASVDGIKTGHTESAGYCLVASAERDGMRLISVVMGTDSLQARAVEPQKLLTWGFRFYNTQQFYSAGDQMTEQQVWKGRSDILSIGVAEDVFLTIPRGDSQALEAEITVDSILQAPVDLGQEVGRMKITYRGETLRELPLVAQEQVEAAGFFGRLWDGLVLFVMQLFGRI
jgi:D-alanyl-D-alanine carboxypeptidase (penicillin-binding protein 5/6)